MRRPLLLALLAVGLAAPGTANAADPVTFYASPTGPVGGDCTATTPCALETALSFKPLMASAHM